MHAEEGNSDFAWGVHGREMVERDHSWDDMMRTGELRNGLLGRHRKLEGDGSTSGLLAHGGRGSSDPVHSVDGGGGEEELVASQ